MNTLVTVTLIFGLGTWEILIIVLGFFIYFLPAFVGRYKEHAIGILLLNIFLGWTFLGWIGALIWAVSDTKKQFQSVQNTENSSSTSDKKYKCKYCGFEAFENHTFCPVCDKNENGLTLEELRSKNRPEES